jgi:hypothetical protein
MANNDLENLKKLQNPGDIVYGDIGRVEILWWLK